MRTRTTTTAGRETSASTVRALLATGLGLILLSGAGGAAGLWSTEVSASTSTVSDGELSFQVVGGR